MSKSLLVLVVVALLVVSTLGASDAIAKLKAKVESGAAPCAKGAHASAPAPPRQFLDIRLPVVVDDYHAPVGGFNPSHIPGKEVDIAARKILREIQVQQAEDKANGVEVETVDPNLEMTTEEHTALKQLLLDADILIRAAGKLNAENGPISAQQVAKSAVKAAAQAEKLLKKHEAAPAAAAAAPAAAAAAPAAAAVTQPTATVPSATPSVGAVAGATTIKSSKAAVRPVVQAVAGSTTAKSSKAAVRA